MEDKTEKLTTKKRKFNEDKLDSSFYCPLCGDKVQCMLAYPHLKECIYYFELAFDITPKPLSVTSYPDTHIFNPPPSCPLSFNINLLFLHLLILKLLLFYLLILHLDPEKKLFAM